ncbi:response regulator transcription factor [uncultured Dokdonia sp.]|uniref:response regulator transcription factor n=1 Tax=uncultured Dokdonia sp. TaxID=575653 RepID=UPI00260BFFB3|nr:response regulator transcription factor [uncultured Dokdonia sp.]
MTEKKNIRIIIADDHQLFIDGLKSLLIHQPHIEVIGEAANGVEAIQLVREHEIDIAVLDINMPELDGTEATKVIKKEFPHVKTLILTMHDESSFIRELMVELSADGYILKNRGKEEFVEALETIASGKEYLKGEVLSTLLKGVKTPQVQNIHLTNRELQVLQLIIEDHTSGEIAAKLNIAVSTVETYRRNLIEKTGVKSSIGLVKYALDNDLYKNE